MQPLHPLDALSPAFERTRQTILTPFKLGRAWKLCACSYLAFAGTVFLPFPLALLLVPGALRPSIAPAPLLLLLLLVPFLLFLALFYVGNRMAFVEFEMLVTRAKFVAPMWNRYGAKAWPLLALKVGWGTLASVAFAPLLLARGRALFAQLPDRLQPTQAGAQPNLAHFQSFFNQMMGLYALFLALYFVTKLFDTLVNDFVLPFYAIEDIPLASAIARGWDVVRREPWQVLLYLIVKFLLALVGYVCLAIATTVCEIPLLILCAILFAFGMLITHVMPGEAGRLLVLVGGVLLYGALYLAFMGLILGFTGYLFSLLEAYAVFFLGGRYQKLGDYLEPPSYTYTPPPLPPTEEEDDDEGGPSLPMDPALV